MPAAWFSVHPCSTLSGMSTGNLGDSNLITEQELKDHFYQYGEIRNITVVHKNQCAFVQYVAR